MRLSTKQKRARRSRRAWYKATTEMRAKHYCFICRAYHY